VHLARQIAGRFGAPVVFATVVDADADASTREAASALVRHAVETSDVEASWTVESGHPADRLVGLATERGASFLVVGNHGPRSSMLGSVSADVSRRGPCPVVVVPPTAHGDAGEPVGAATGVA
jgi:nucleotide-binding universal stress UspA family protein